MTARTFASELLRAFCFLLAALAAVGIVLAPIPANAASVAPVGVAPVEVGQAIPLPRVKQKQRAKAKVGAPMDLAAVAAMPVPAHIRAKAWERANQLATQDTIGVLTRQQIIDFARSNPAFVKKLMHAYRTGTVPHFTPEERALLAAATGATMDDLRAAGPASKDDGAPNWLLALVIIIMFILVLWGYSPTWWNR